MKKRNTISNNIAVGEEVIDKEQLLDAIKIANFLAILPYLILTRRSQNSLRKRNFRLIESVSVKCERRGQI